MTILNEFVWMAVKYDIVVVNINVCPSFLVVFHFLFFIFFASQVKAKWEGGEGLLLFVRREGERVQDVS